LHWQARSPQVLSIEAHDLHTKGDKGREHQRRVLVRETLLSSKTAFIDQKSGLYTPKRHETAGGDGGDGEGVPTPDTTSISHATRNAQ
jgi:hypothetical protein